MTSTVCNFVDVIILNLCRIYLLLDWILAHHDYFRSNHCHCFLVVLGFGWPCCCFGKFYLQFISYCFRLVFLSEESRFTRISHWKDLLLVSLFVSLLGFPYFHMFTSTNTFLSLEPSPPPWLNCSWITSMTTCPFQSWVVLHWLWQNGDWVLRFHSFKLF